ncbi:hypothetical protein HJC23_001670 [Cyclotella cryptica]|uniref:ApaG domain-containing protein n=1 Tax=Cyclotella cryptica TaxID=29204 RepID=A0ABD3QLG1_9STRA
MPKNLLIAFDVLPQAITTTSILPFVSSDDWLAFRAVCRGCYEIVHGTNDVLHSFCPLCQSTSHSTGTDSNPLSSSSRCSSTQANDESDSLWNLALVRDYRFEIGVDEGNYMKQAIHSPITGTISFLSTNDVFRASTSFISWKHWRKLEGRRDHGQSSSADSNSLKKNRCTNPYRQVVGPYYLRAASLWKKIEQWCDNESLSRGLGREIKASLVPGIDVLRGGKFQNDALITALAAVYSFYSGQEHGSGQSLGGFFGGYSAYNFGCMMEWYHWRHDISVAVGDSFLIAFDSLINLQNSIYMDMKSGQVSAVNESTKETMPATPVTRIEHTKSSGVDDTPKICIDPEDSILRWFEEHARRLSTGYYCIGQLISSSRSLSILQYPAVNEIAVCSRAVTRGVEVVASSIFHPYSNLSDDGAMFVYSIRMRILTPEDGDEYASSGQRGFTTCQLRSRHWIVTKQISSPHGDLTRVEEVRGEGVVGEYPLLREGGYQNYYSSHGADPHTLALIGQGIGDFRYQSCTDHLSRIFEGFLQFVPGSLLSPEGEAFSVRVAPFHFHSNPGFYY